MTSCRCRSFGAVCIGAAAPRLLRARRAARRIVVRLGLDAANVRMVRNAGSMIRGETTCKERRASGTLLAFAQRAGAPSRRARMKHRSRLFLCAAKGLRARRRAERRSCQQRWLSREDIARSARATQPLRSGGVIARQGTEPSSYPGPAPGSLRSRGDSRPGLWRNTCAPAPRVPDGWHGPPPLVSGWRQAEPCRLASYNRASHPRSM